MRRMLLAGIAAVAVLATAAQALKHAAHHPGGGDAASAGGGALAEERRIRDMDIEFYRERITHDPTGAIDPMQLGALYLRRYRESGDESDLATAETLARRSLANRADRNPSGWQLLAGALMGQHRFLEAKTVAERLLAMDPESAGAQATLGEVLLERGDYPGADRIFARLTPQRFNLGVAPRYARWLELRGRVSQARQLLEWARDAASRDANLPLEQRAWYELRLGELALRFDAHAEARTRLVAGLALVPDDWRLLAARARLALEVEDYRTTIALGDSSLARHLDPATLAAVGDAWRARGDSVKAEEYYHAMEAATRAPRGGFHRAWYLALLDHDRRVPDVLRAVTKDLETRPDVYGYDLEAWALFKSGRIGEARAAMSRALAWGTEDPLLHRHAAAIEAAR
jgi:tetratricopeptide (TPR) repeat protein